MEFNESLELERYKFVVDRQRYFTELARDAFASYMRFFSGLAAGGIAIVSARKSLDLDPPVVAHLIGLDAKLVAVLALLASGQIVFCLARWKGFRDAERAINPKSPETRSWWWMSESLYMVAIVATAAVALSVSRALPDVLAASRAGG